MEEQNKMTFWDHLEVFRWSLVRIAAVTVALMFVYFALLRTFYDSFVLGPTTSDFFLYKIIPQFRGDYHVDIININVASQFMTHVTTSFWFALVTAFPYILWEVWHFVSPALYPGEQRPVRFAFLFGTGMFYLGCVVGYSVVFPFMFRFLTEYQLSADITNQISLNSYMSNFLTMVFVMGLVFEMPLLIWLLSRMGLIDKTFLRTYRRHAIVALLALAALITPSGDPFTLTVVFTPLYLLYELGMHGFSLVGELCRDVADFAAAVHVLELVVFHCKNVNERVERCSGVARELNVNRLAAEGFLDGVLDIVPVSLFAVELVDGEDERKVGVGSVAGKYLGSYLDALLSVHNENSVFAYLECRECATAEIICARSVDYVDLLSVELGVKRSSVNGSLVEFLDLYIVGNGVLVLNGAPSVNDLAFVKHCFCQSGLTGFGRADENHVADVFG